MTKKVDLINPEIFISAKNFEGHDFDAAFPLSGNNSIVKGRNGSGKTRIARALLWATGSNHDIVKCQKEGEVALKFVNEEKESAREIIVKGTPKGRVFIKDGEIYEYQYNTNVMSLILMPELFFSMSTNEVREAIVSAMPKVDLNSVYQKIYKEPYPKKLNDEDEVAREYKRLNKERLSLEKTVAASEQEICTLGEQLEDIPEFDEKRLQELGSQIKTMVEANRQNDIFEQWDRFKANLLEEVGQISEGAAVFDEQEYENLRNSYRDGHDALRVMETKLRSIESSGRSLAQELMETENTLIAEKCDKCGADLDPEKIYDLKKVIEDKIDSLKEKIVDARQKYSETANDIQEEKTILTQQHDKIKEQQELAEQHRVFKNLQKQLAQHEKKRPENPIRTFSGELDQAQDEITMLKAASVLKDQNAKNQRALERAKTSLKDVQSRYDEIAKLEARMHPKKGFLSKFAVSVNAPKIEGFDLSLQKTQVNGKKKPDLIITRERDGVSIFGLSSGEKVKFCIAFAEMLDSLSGFNVGFSWISTADLIDKIPETKRSLIIEKVEDCDVKICP